MRVVQCILYLYPREKEVAFTKVTASVDDFLRSGYMYIQVDIYEMDVISLLKP